MSAPVSAALLLKWIDEGQSGPELNEAVARCLGWLPRKVTGLGLNGRTPGRWGWVEPDPPWAWRAKLPNLVGPRSRSKTRAALASTPSGANHA